MFTNYKTAKFRASKWMRTILFIISHQLLLNFLLYLSKMNELIFLQENIVHINYLLFKKKKFNSSLSKSNIYENISI